MFIYSEQLLPVFHFSFSNVHPPSSKNKKKCNLPATSITISQELLRQIIEKTGLSLYAIAKQIKLPHNTILRIYSGKIKKPTLLIFRKILGLYCLYCLEARDALEKQDKQHH